jgi:hypothetical protein
MFLKLGAKNANEIRKVAPYLKALRRSMGTSVLCDFYRGTSPCRATLLPLYGTISGGPLSDPSV